MSIVIGCDSFLALRNVRNGNLGKHLAGHRVLVWVDPHQLEGCLAVQPEGVELGCLEQFDARKDEKLHRLMARAYSARKCYYDPITHWVELLMSSSRRNQNKQFRRTASISRAIGRLACFWLAGRLGLAQYWRKQFSNALRSHPILDVYRRRLQEVEASVVVSFSPEGFREMALIEAANSLNIPTAVMIRSRDNLASKIAHLPYAEAYLVWSNVIGRFLLQMYPEIPAEHVYVTGSPQFDHHLDPSYCLERDKFFSLVGLNPARPLIVYSMATPGLIDHEIEIAQHLADAANAGAFVRGAQLLVRGHPRMFGSNIKLLRREYTEARTYPEPTNAAYRGEIHESDVVRRIIEDEPVHLSGLAYQDVQVNVCGTMTIDSAIFDKPTVNIFYDLAQEVSYGMSVRRFYERTDVKEMMEYKASRLASDPDDCIRLINRYLADPTIDAEGRKRAREQDCGPLDGRSGERIASTLRILASRLAT
jgi:hypothetical protein